MNPVKELKRRNPALFWYGVLNLAAALVCVVFWINSNTMVNNINAFIKPFKFFISISIFCFTMGWLMYYLQRPVAQSAYNIMAMVVFTFESAIITWQAANGRLSHFNTTTPLYGILFSLMGVAIVLLTVWTGWIGLQFFRKINVPISRSYLWGIRLGFVAFVLFAFEGGIMASALRHTVGAEDGGAGLPVVNWSREHGDLRIAHFFGMHSLQIFPLFGFYFAKTPKAVFIFAGVYVALVGSVLVQALMGLPLV